MCCNFSIFLVPVRSCDLQRDLWDVLLVGCLPQNNRSHFQVLLFSLPTSISHNDMGLMCVGGVKEAQSEGLSLCSACTHTRTHTQIETV